MLKLTKNESKKTVTLLKNRITARMKKKNANDPDKTNELDTTSKEPWDQSAIGIDAGTTFSSVAKVQKGISNTIEGVTCVMIPDEDGDMTIPSVAFFDKPSDPEFPP